MPYETFLGGGGGGAAKQKYRPPWLADVENLKKKKKKHLLKRPKAVSQKRNLDQNINDSKFKIILFWKYSYEYSIFIRVFFNFRFFCRKSQSQQKLPKKDHSFYYRVSVKTPLSGIKLRVLSKKSTCAIMIRTIVTFANQISL